MYLYASKTHFRDRKMNRKLRFEISAKFARTVMNRLMVCNGTFAEYHPIKSEIAVDSSRSLN